MRYKTVDQSFFNREKVIEREGQIKYNCYQYYKAIADTNKLGHNQ